MNKLAFLGRMFYGVKPSHLFTMALSESIDDDAFETAYDLTVRTTPEHLLNEVFIAQLTRHLISELYRAGVDEVRNDRAHSTNKIQAAIESVRHSKGDKWPIYIKNRKALKEAIEFVLASRTSISEYPKSVKRITKKFSVIPQANLPDELKR